MLATLRAHPPSMYGRLRPQRDVELSANTPINGWIKNPESGPARNTIAMFDLVRPSESRYGDAVSSGASAIGRTWNRVGERTV